MSNLALIPARGKSKRIPRKNIKEFMGKPIIAYSIEIALKSDLFDEVMVSTDDMEIAEIAMKYGAKVPFMRSAERADDYAKTIDVIKEVINDYNCKLGRKFDLICCIYPAAPLIKVSHIKAGLEILRKNNFDSVFPVKSFSYPIWRGLKIDTSGKINMIWPEYVNSRSQDLDKVYHDAGQWYWLRTSKINYGIFNKNSGAIVLSELEVQDIDTPYDWEMAVMKYKLMYGIRDSYTD